ncbi:MAG TPA: hypothetical protein VGB94_03665 [Acidobacteriaceae bacterium]
MASSRKKVILRRINGTSSATIVPGYLPQSGFVTGSGSAAVLELLDLDGHVLPIPLREVRMVSFVRDFNPSDRINPERLLRKTFLARPRAEGLQLRITFHDGDVLEGLAANDISLLDSAADDAGLQMAPPDTRSNTQRIYIPRTSIAELVVVATIGQARPKQAPAAKPTQTVQEGLFDDLPSNSRPN